MSAHDLTIKLNFKVKTLTSDNMMTNARIRKDSKQKKNERYVT